MLNYWWIGDFFGGAVYISEIAGYSELVMIEIISKEGWN